MPGLPTWLQMAGVEEVHISAVMTLHQLNMKQSLSYISCIDCRTPECVKMFLHPSLGAAVSSSHAAGGSLVI